MEKVDNPQIFPIKEIKNINLVTLDFDCYEFYKFVEAIEKYTDECKFYFRKNEFLIKFMDASKIMLAKISKTIENDLEFEKGLNLNDLKSLLQTRKNDLKTVKLKFEKDNAKEMYLVKESNKIRSIINRKLALLDLNIEEFPMETLEMIDYTAKASFPCKFLDDLFYESGKISEIVLIEVNEPKGISFTEDDQIGTSEYLIKSSDCIEIKGFEKACYSLAFLMALKPLVSILDDNTSINLSLKKDHPIKIEFQLENLDLNFLIFLAPRVEEEEAEFKDEEDSI